MGTVKLFLALCVLFSHIGGFLSVILLNAGVAVNCFFIISGFFMTLGLNQRYTSSKTNTAFYISRFFRIWPLYFLSLVILYPWGVVSQVYERITQLPISMKVLSLFSNFFIIGIDLLLHISVFDGHVIHSEYGIDVNHNGASYILNLPAWSLSIELIFYALAPFVVRSFPKSVAFFLIGFLYCTYLKYVNTQIAFSLRTDILFPNAMLYFGLGSVAYWIRRKFPFRNFRDVIPWVIFIIFAYFGIVGSKVEFAVLTTLAVFCEFLFDLTKSSKIDKFLGDLAYPVYVLQIPVSSMVRSLGYFEATTISYFFSVMLVSIFVLVAFDRPVEKFRTSLRKKKMNEIDSPALSEHQQ